MRSEGEGGGREREAQRQSGRIRQVRSLPRQTRRTVAPEYACTKARFRCIEEQSQVERRLERVFCRARARAVPWV